MLGYSPGKDANTGIKPKDLTPPADVTDLAATIGNTQVGLSWANPSDVDFVGVKILRKTSGYPASSTDGTVVYEGGGTSHADTGLTNGETYYYKAYTYDEVANFAPGVQASATPADFIPPSNITDFTVAEGLNNGELTATWSNPSEGDFVGVRFSYRTDGAFPTSVIDGILLSDETGSGGASDGVTWTGLDSEKTYYIKGFSYDGVTNYASGTNADLSINPKDLTAPGGISGFTAPALIVSQLALSWANPSDIDLVGVKILRKTIGFPTSTTDLEFRQRYLM